MDLSSAVYAYHFANVSVSPDAFGYAVGAAFVIVTALAVAFGPYVYGFAVYRKKEAERLEKRRTLQNLVIMKDIQTELEDEMRRALTNANISQ